MAIAKNFRQFAEALLYQLELPLHGIERTIQNMRGAVRECYRRSILAGTWDKARFLPKRRTFRTFNRPDVAWHQLALWLYVADQLQLL